MKNKVLLLILMIGLSAIISCKRNYKCKCAGGIFYHEYEQEINATKKKAAIEECEGHNPPPYSPDGIYCELK